MSPHDPMPAPPPDSDWTAEKAKALEAELLEWAAMLSGFAQLDSLAAPYIDRLQRAANMIQTQRLLLEGRRKFPVPVEDPS